MAEDLGQRATAAELYAMSKHLGVKCHDPEVAYLACKDKFNHPSDCLKEARGVLKCSQNLLLEMLDRAPQEFRDYVDCLDYYTLGLKKCRKEQQALEKVLPPSSL